MGPTAIVLVAATLTGCAVHGPKPAPLPAPPAAWSAPVPHGGQPQQLRDWWQRFDDPQLLALIDAAQQASPTVAAAAARIAQAQAVILQTDGARWPTAEVQSSVARGVQTTVPGLPVGTLAQARLQASWEMDLFGRLAANREAAKARQVGAEAAWHEARVSVAADTANQYFAWQHCHQQLALAQQDLASRERSAQLTRQLAQSGLASPLTATQTDNQVLDGQSRVTSQAAQCQVALQALVALTGLPAPGIERNRSHALDGIHKLAPFSIANVPAQALNQRPDLVAAERELAAASADVAVAKADRYPRLTLSGNVGAMNMRLTNGTALDVRTWSVGPVALTLPILDGNRGKANQLVAEANYELAANQYRAKARQAVREVEDALTQLESTRQRLAHAQQLAQRSAQAERATDALVQAGLGSRRDAEDATRSTVAANSQLLAIQQEWLTAWINLYRAVGGGWELQTSG